ncbi:MAG: cytochrome c4 [Methylovulum sp.]|jgi:cytochrome c553|nr:cytochrome c4 [Methylovulum sp.]
MNKIILFLMLSMPVIVYAEASSTIAWTPATLNFVKQGNPVKGKVLAESCTGCHGEQGISALPETPSLAGQLATYTYKQLRDYANNLRSNPTMSAMVQGLSAQDSADLAVWFSTLTPSLGTPNKPSPNAEKLVQQGDGKRIIPPCFVCHGENGQGEKMDIPALTGQRGDYLSKTLVDYKTGQRHNDVYSRMRLIAQQLKDSEIKELALYYQRNPKP